MPTFTFFIHENDFAFSVPSVSSVVKTIPELRVSVVN
jgi:hypothetical protein